MKAHFVLLTLAAVASCAGRMQPAADDPTAGLPGPGQPAVVFAPGVISTNDVFASTFTPDGRMVVFTKVALPRMWMMSSTWENGAWSTPVSLPFPGGEYRDLDPAFTPDGSRLYFSSLRPVSGTDTTNRIDTWFMRRGASGWSAPERLPSPVNSADVDMYPSLTSRGVLYFDSQRSRPAKRWVYRSEPQPDGTLSAPELLPPIINADSGASNFFIDPEERYAVFGAARPGGFGSADLHISWRRNGSWTTPVNLGPLVNSAATDFCPYVSPDGKYLYFTRAVTRSPTDVSRNIFVVRFDALRESLAPSQ